MGSRKAWDPRWFSLVSEVLSSQHLEGDDARLQASGPMGGRESGRQRQENQELRGILCYLIELGASLNNTRPVSKTKNFVAGKFAEWVEGLSWAHKDPGSE